MASMRSMYSERGSSPISFNALQDVSWQEEEEEAEDEEEEEEEEEEGGRGKKREEEKEEIILFHVLFCEVFFF
jgi:hypothetical protein